MKSLSFRKIFLAHGGRALLVNMLAVIALILAALTDEIAAPLLLISFVILLLVAMQRKRLRRALVSSVTLGSYIVARTVSLGTLLSVSLRGDKLPLFGPAVIALVVIVLAEPTVRSLTSSAYPYAANVPGVPERNEARIGYGLVFLAGLVATVVGILVVSVAPALLILFLVLTGATVVLYFLALIDVVGRVQARRRFDQTAFEVLSTQKPEFLVHWHAPTGNSYQISMWLPYLDMLGAKYAIIARTTGNFRDLQKVTDRPVILRKALEEIDDVVVPSVNAVFYVNSATRNGHLIRFAHLTHIQLNHGESDKATSYSPVFRMYDYNFVAGQAAIDRFKLHNVDVRPEMFRIVGRPQVSAIEVAAGISIIPSQEKSLVPGRRTVLYAPTWSGFYNDTNYSSVPFAYEIITALIARDCSVVFRPHPYTRHSPRSADECEKIRSLLAEDERRSGRKHFYGEEAEREMSVFECFNLSDAMISDVSSVVGDYLYSEKPYSMVTTMMSPGEFSEKFPMARASYILAAYQNRVENLSDVLEDLLLTDPKRDFRREMKTYYLGDIPHDRYVQHFVDVAKAVLAEAGEKSSASGRSA